MRSKVARACAPRMILLVRPRYSSIRSFVRIGASIAACTDWEQCLAFRLCLTLSQLFAQSESSRLSLHIRRALRGAKARWRRNNGTGMTRRIARQSETKSDRRLSDSDLAGCVRLRQGATDGDGRYSALNQMTCIGERMTHLTAKMKRDIGAALELKRQSASCNRGQYRPQR